MYAYFVSHVLFYPKSLVCAVSGSWPSQKFWAWSSCHEVWIKLNQSLTGHSHNFCTTIDQAHLASRYFKPRVLWLDWSPHLCFGSLQSTCTRSTLYMMWLLAWCFCVIPNCRSVYAFVWSWYSFGDLLGCPGLHQYEGFCLLFLSLFCDAGLLAYCLLKVHSFLHRNCKGKECRPYEKIWDDWMKMAETEGRKTLNKMYYVGENVFSIKKKTPGLL